MPAHSYTIAQRLKTILEELVADVSSDLDNASYTTVSRTAMRPSVRYRKRRASRGREDEGLMTIEEGISIIPMEPVKVPGTNERDGVGYRFLVALADGTLTDEIGPEWPIPIWEQAIRQRLNNKRMGSLALDDGCEQRTSVEPGELPNWAKLEDGIDASFLVVTEYVRESRTS